MSRFNDGLEQGWKVWRFDEMATNVNIRIDNPAESGLEHYVGLEHLDANSLKIRRWGSPNDVEATKLMFEKGDIIFGRRRAYQRKLGVAEFDGICSAHAMVLRAKSTVVRPEFLPFFMQSDLFMKRAIDISVGSLSPTINWKTMAAQEFALPSLDQQEHLVQALVAIENAVVEQQNMLQEVNNLQESLLKTWWSQNEDSARMLGDISLVSGAYGINASAKEIAAGEPRYIRITDIDGNGQLIASERVGVDNPSVDAYLLTDGDLLIARTGNTVGKSFLYSDSDGPAVYAGYLVKFRLNPTLALPKYIFFMTRSSQYRDWIASTVRVGAQPNINAKEYSSLRVPVPKIEKQKYLIDLADRLQEARSQCDTRIRRLRDIKYAFLAVEVVHAI